MAKGWMVIVGLISSGLSVIALAVLGHLTIFEDLDWIYLVIVLVIFALGTVLLYNSAEKEKRFSVYCEVMSGAFGWVAILASIGGLWFIIAALFLDGSWWEFGYAALIGTLSKGIARSFHQSKLEDIQPSKVICSSLICFDCF